MINYPYRTESPFLPAICNTLGLSTDKVPDLYFIFCYEDYDVEVKKLNFQKNLLEYKQYSSGFIVKITSTRRKITAATKDNIKKQLSRRFYIDHSKTQFDLKIDGKKT